LFIGKVSQTLAHHASKENRGYLLVFAIIFTLVSAEIRVKIRVKTKGTQTSDL
jgi:hypothetical protein